VHLGVLRLQRQRVAAGRLGFVEPVEVALGIGQVVPHLDAPRRQRGRLAREWRHLAKRAGAAQRVAQVGHDHRLVRRQPIGLAQIRQRLRRAAQPQQRVAGQMLRARVGGVQRRRAREAGRLPAPFAPATAAPGPGCCAHDAKRGASRTARRYASTASASRLAARYVLPRL
jgi:transcription initiation factor TFIID subunit TAF12